jgi:hypothetical protein
LTVDAKHKRSEPVVGRRLEAAIRHLRESIGQVTIAGVEGVEQPTSSNPKTIIAQSKLKI